MDLLKALFFGFPEEKPENYNFLLEFPGRYLKSHNINATSPAKTHRVTHIFSKVQQDCLTLKMETIRPSATSGNASHPTRTEQSATPLTEPEFTQQ